VAPAEDSRPEEESLLGQVSNNRPLPAPSSKHTLLRYLVKLEVRNDAMADPDVADLYEQYVATIERFKEVHKENETVKNSGYGGDKASIILLALSL